MRLWLHVTLSAAALSIAAPASAQSLFTTFEDAPLVVSRGVAVTPSITSVAAMFNGTTERFGTLYGARVTFGAGERADISATVGRFQEAGGGGVNLMNLGVKVPLSAGRVALLAPVGFSFGSGIEEVGQTAHVDPGIVFTTPIGTMVDLNPSARVILPFCDECHPLLGFEVGVGMRSSDSRVNVRPTFGVVVNPRESGVIWTVGGAVTLATKRR
jgi:hypothetical protein